MFEKKYTRREFIRLAAAGIIGLAFRPLFKRWESFAGEDVLRICTESVSVYSQPDDTSEIRFQRFRDDLVHVYREVISDRTPKYNPRWYRVWGGYIHSAHTYRVTPRLNPVLPHIPESGLLAQITVPYTQAMRKDGRGGWRPVYRLYADSNHWITGVEEGPDGEPWYKIIDELLEVDYHVPAAHMRAFTSADFAPISPDVPPEKKRILVSIAEQTLTAYEGDQVVLHTEVSTGIPSPKVPGRIPTSTPRGTFHIQVKMPSKHMGDGNLTDDIEAYELPGVPWTGFFEPKTGVAFHGAFWHNNFGRMMSHGCVNMRVHEAQWLYRWTTPVAEMDHWDKKGYGTVVIVD